MSFAARVTAASTFLTRVFPKCHQGNDHHSQDHDYQSHTKHGLACAHLMHGHDGEDVQQKAVEHECPGYPDK
jgi:hypothetical protein